MTAEMTQLHVSEAGEAKARVASLLLAYRHGNQQAFDDCLARDTTPEEARELVTALAWVANEAVRTAYRPDVADRVLRHLARRVPDEPGWVETDEEGAPDVAVLLEAVWRGDTEAVRGLVRATPDTTFVLGKLLYAVARLLPSVPRAELRRVLTDLRGERPPGLPGRRC
ncbi:hypothetical protein GCM10010218_08540 [Streptomyces mashuensis]|uniref:Uncharacterized protein n=1 Tax=Streptomyces mashuensis TaxID=33904 RepID=A0A919EAA6_9ACTN|nr:hypothetical protein [Streptomyces mashuensis]GHF29668.1 hypothetical protein GCM10010218_08540 [Streptomyces mashuensis]